MKTFHESDSIGRCIDIRWTFETCELVVHNRSERSPKKKLPIFDVTYNLVHAHSYLYIHITRTHITDIQPISSLYITSTRRTKERFKKKRIYRVSGHVSLDLPQNYLDDSIIKNGVPVSPRFPRY